MEKTDIRVLLLCSGKRVQLVAGAAKFLPAYSVLVSSEVKKKASFDVFTVKEAPAQKQAVVFCKH